MTPLTSRPLMYGLVISICVSSFLWLGFKAAPSRSWSSSSSPSTDLADEADVDVVVDAFGIDEIRKIDLGAYVYRQTVAAAELGLDDPSRRVVIVGDIHGQWSAFQAILDQVSYDPARDTLFHLGDVLAKGKDSGKVIDWLAQRRVKGVRGNHDQKVVGWRLWQDWVESMPGGKQWLKKVEKLSTSDFHSTKHKHAESKSDKAHRKQFAFPSTRDWVWASEHYWLARRLSPAQAQYLRSLPLTIHLPSLGAHLVHAGMMPIQLRQNRPDPWSLMNIRSVLKSGAASRKFDGTPWTQLFNQYQESLVPPASSSSEGEAEAEAEKADSREGVVFGHAAKLGLQVERWTLGLDTGCVYGRELTAVVIDAAESVGIESESEGGEEGQKVHVGNTMGRLVSVRCKEPK